MKRKRVALFVILVLIVIIGVVVNIIGNDYGAYTYKGDLYFLNETDTAIEAEQREIHYHNESDLAEAVVKAIMKGPKENRHRKIIDGKTHLLSVSGMDTGNVIVNFSREFITGNARKDILAVYAVVKSLCAIDGITGVKVVTEGKDISSSDGSIIGYLTDGDINLPTDTTSSEMREITLYFPYKGERTLTKEVRSIRVNDQQPLAQYIINELIKGSNKDGVESDISKDTVLLSVETSKNICFVNFKADFLDKNSGSADKEKMIIFSIVDSLTEIKSIDRVQFLMDGKKVTQFGNINISGTFGRDDSLISQ